MMRRLLPLLGLVLGACGYTDTGSGTRTLQVEASSSFDVTDGNDSRVRVTVRQADGTNVDDASVNVKDGDSGAVIAVPADGNGGRYSVDVPGYRRRLELAVARGSDRLDVKLEGPGPHTITSPVPGQVVSGNTLGVSWATKDGVAADEVSLDIRHTQAQRLLTTDTGSSNDLSLAGLSAGTYDLDVTRQNVVVPGGGVTGSTFTISYNVSTEFIVSP